MPSFLLLWGTASSKCKESLPERERLEIGIGLSPRHGACFESGMEKVEVLFSLPHDMEIEMIFNHGKKRKSSAQNQTPAHHPPPPHAKSSLPTPQSKIGEGAGREGWVWGVWW